MAQRSFTVGIPEELEQRIVVEARRLDITRNAFVRRALEAALEPSLDDPATQAAKRDFLEAQKASPDGVGIRVEAGSTQPSANYGSHERYGPRKPRGKPFQKS